METIRNSKVRIGNFTSSGMGKLFATPAKIKTYIKELNFERKLGRSLTKEVSTRDIAWGHLCESFVFSNLLDESYTLTSSTSILHPTIKSWAGSPEGKKGETVVYDIKAFQLKKFCEIIETFETNDPEQLKEEFPSEFWQLVSNVILLSTEEKPIIQAELIVYCPYQSELDALRKFADELDDFELQKQLYWLAGASDEEMSYVIDGGNYSNINKFLFEVTEKDKKTLTDKILEYEKQLITV